MLRVNGLVSTLKAYLKRQLLVLILEEMYQMNHLNTKITVTKGSEPNGINKTKDIVYNFVSMYFFHFLLITIGQMYSQIRNRGEKKNDRPF